MNNSMIVFQNTRKKVFCHICGCQSSFLSPEGVSLREAMCPECEATQRASDIAGVIIHTFLKNDTLPLFKISLSLAYLKIYEAQSTGIIHDCLKNFPDYHCSEYFDDVKPGELHRNGIICQDLQKLTFSDNSFDLVITQDVFEHIQDPDKAFVEIYRVLKPGGFHIFTIPYHEGKKTLRRITIEDGKEILKYPPVYHGDPLRERGAPVFSDFGEDLISNLELQGFETDAFLCGQWYNSDEIPTIRDETSYDTYLKYYNTNDLCRFFKYNSWVFRSQKPKTRVKNNA
jgi:SAM-dependent methyltransferase